MKRQIYKSDRSIQIEISDIDGNERALLKEFEKCQTGNCSCPTKEYSKLDSMNIEEIEGVITLRLKAKDGLSFDVAEIEKCLDHSKKQVESFKE